MSDGDDDDITSERWLWMACQVRDSPCQLKSGLSQHETTWPFMKVFCEISVSLCYSAAQLYEQLLSWWLNPAADAGDDDDDDDDDDVTSHRDALLKMQDVYRQNAKLGDPDSLDAQLEDNAQKLDCLQKEVTKYQACRRFISLADYSASRSLHWLLKMWCYV